MVDKSKKQGKAKVSKFFTLSLVIKGFAYIALIAALFAVPDLLFVIVLAFALLIFSDISTFATFHKEHRAKTKILLTTAFGIILGVLAGFTVIGLKAMRDCDESWCPDSWLILGGLLYLPLFLLGAGAILLIEYLIMSNMESKRGLPKKSKATEISESSVKSTIRRALFWMIVAAASILFVFIDSEGPFIFFLSPAVIVLIFISVITSFFLLGDYMATRKGGQLNRRRRIIWRIFMVLAALILCGIIFFVIPENNKTMLEFYKVWFFRRN